MKQDRKEVVIIKATSEVAEAAISRIVEDIRTEEETPTAEDFEEEAEIAEADIKIVTDIKIVMVIKTAMVIKADKIKGTTTGTMTNAKIIMGIKEEITTPITIKGTYTISRTKIIMVRDASHRHPTTTIRPHHPFHQETRI